MESHSSPLSHPNPGKGRGGCGLRTAGSKDSTLSILFHSLVFASSSPLDSSSGPASPKRHCFSCSCKHSYPQRKKVLLSLVSIGKRPEEKLWLSLCHVLMMGQIVVVRGVGPVTEGRWGVWCWADKNNSHYDDEKSVGIKATVVIQWIFIKPLLWARHGSRYYFLL